MWLIRLIKSLCLLVCLPMLAWGDITTSLSSEWRMNEGTGTTTADTGGGGRTITFGASTTAPTWGINCHHGSCVTFDGVNDLATMSSITLGTTFTLAFWLYPDSTMAGYGDLLSDANGSVGFYVQNATWQLYYFNPAGFGTSIAATPDTWNFVVFSCNAGTLTIYINGTSEVPAGTVVSAAVTQFGADAGGNPLKGRLDDMRYYAGRALGATDIAELRSFGAVRHKSRGQ